MSLCRNRNPYDEDPINVSNNLPKKGIEDIKTNPINLAQGSLRRTKKNKTRMPKDFVFTEEEEQILDKFRQKEKESNSLNFHGDSDDEKLKDEKNANVQNEEEKEKEKIEEIINTDMPKKDENENRIDNDNKEEKNEEKKEEIKNINNEENEEEEQKNEKENEIIDDKNEIKEEHVEKQENENNKEEKKENENKDEEKEEEREEEKEKEEEEIKEKENNIIQIQQENDKKEEIDKEKEIKEEHIEKEEEKNEFIDKNQEEEENKEIEEEKNEKDEKKEIKPVEEKKIDIVNNEEKIETENKVNLRSRPIKKEEQIQKEENEKIEKEKEEKVDEDEEEEEEEDDEDAKNIKQKEEQKDLPQESEIKDLSKYDSLIKIININLEGLGYSKSDIIKEIDELFNSFSDKIKLDDLTSKLSEQLIKKMEITVDSDKTEINNFIKDLVNFYSGDKDKIYGQIMNYIETIEEQSKLNTRTLNRAIRSNIQGCKDKLKERLKEDDIPSDKIISLEKFEKLVEETGLQMKDNHMTVLLYQMKKAVPKGRNFNTLNAIVIVDFLK